MPSIAVPGRRREAFEWTFEFQVTIEVSLLKESKHNNYYTRLGGLPA